LVGSFKSKGGDRAVDSSSKERDTSSSLCKNKIYYDHSGSCLKFKMRRPRLKGMRKKSMKRRETSPPLPLHCMTLFNRSSRTEVELE